MTAIKPDLLASKENLRGCVIFFFFVPKAPKSPPLWLERLWDQETLWEYRSFPNFFLGGYYLFISPFIKYFSCFREFIKCSYFRSQSLLGKQLCFPLHQRILQQMVSYISLSFCPLGANNASCFARRLISFALNVNQTLVLLVLLKIATPAEYVWMDQAASTPTERRFPQGMQRLAYKVSLRALKHLLALFKCSIQQSYRAKTQISSELLQEGRHLRKRFETLLNPVDECGLAQN